MMLEFLREQILELKQQRDEAIGQLGAVNGALQFCEYLINKLEGEQSPSSEEVPPEGE